MKTMFKLISMKTIGVTAVSLALLAGTLATPAFAKGGYNNTITVTSNRGYTSDKVTIRHFGGFKVVGLQKTIERFGPGFVDLRFVYNKLTLVSGN
jgi:hypothetical protein